MGKVIAVIDAHFLPEHHFDSLVKELRGTGCELREDNHLKLIFIEGKKEAILKVGQKYDQKVDFL